MKDSETSETYDALVSMLHEFKLDWVLEQATSVIRAGKSSEIEVTTFKEDKGDNQMALTPSSFSPSGKQKFTRTEEFSPRERLLLLLDAIEEAVVNTAEMERDGLSVLNSADDPERQIGTTRTIQLYPLGDQGDEPITLSVQSSETRSVNAKRLREILTSLRKEV